MRRLAAQWFIVSALCFTLGLHWAVLQAVAWTGMIVTYSQDGSLGDAVEKTFNGKAPCKLCKAVAEGKRTERTDTAFQSTKKLDLMSGTPVAALHTPVVRSLHLISPTGWFVRSELPPLPPPRIA
ncbi:MAG: hypothetical protein HC841_04260 [Verrucomicrobiae bacterium]|nr:hypothetical protein [Verrucomicrobiae bacterium]